MAIKTGKKTLFTEINITPLTDIFLVLLIIMMVVAPTFQSIDNSITIPEINSGNSIEQGKVVVSVTKDGTIYVDTKHSSQSDLVSDLELAKKSADSTEVVVKADEKVKSSVIMAIMDAAQDAQYKKLIVAGEPLNKKDQKKLEDNSGYAVQKTQSSTLDGATTALPQDNQYENWGE
ncbi:MAG: biopolymer transporter ExbD [bacterium]|nr:biopolymer transporter ExbD [bacterium]